MENSLFYSDARIFFQFSLVADFRIKTRCTTVSDFNETDHRFKCAESVFAR